MLVLPYVIRAIRANKLTNPFSMRTFGRGSNHCVNKYNIFFQCSCLPLREIWYNIINVQYFNSLLRMSSEVKIRLIGSNTPNSNIQYLLISIIPKRLIQKKKKTVGFYHYIWEHTTALYQITNCNCNISLSYFFHCWICTFQCID